MNTSQIPQGFTLIEILVSLFILTIVGMISASGLNFIVRSEKYVENKQKMLGDIQHTMLTMEQDLRQVRFPEPFLAGVPMIPAIMITDSYMQLSCSALFDPRQQQHGNFPQQVTYQTVGSRLVRYEKMVGSNLSYQVLLSQVRSVHFQMIPQNNPLSDPLHTNSVISSGIIIDIQMENNDNIRRIIPFAISAAETDPVDRVVT